MAYTDLPVPVTGDFITAAYWETYFRQNFLSSAPSIFTTKGDLIVATGNKAASRLGKPADDYEMLMSKSSESTGLTWGKQVNFPGKMFSNDYWGDTIAVGTHVVDATTFFINNSNPIQYFPSDAKAAIISISARWTSASDGSTCKLKNPDDQGTQNCLLVRALVANMFIDNQGIVPLNADHEFAIIVSGAECLVYIDVLGYIL